MEDFIQGKGIKILEINGVNAEPAHIYDPNAKLFDGIKTLLKHWGIIYQISRENKHLASSTGSIKEALDHYNRWRKIKKIA
jgi:hypothetical protein